MAFLPVDEYIQVSEVHLESLPESGIAQVPPPDEFAHGPDRAAKITRCLGKRKQPGIDRCDLFHYGIAGLHESLGDSLNYGAIVGVNPRIFN